MNTDADADTVPAGPTDAEQVRTVLSRATSLSLTTTAQAYDLIGLHSVSAAGQVTLHPSPDSPLAREAADAPMGSLAALLQFTDIAPTPLRDRVRARVTVSGWLAPETDGALRLDSARVSLRTPAGATDVGLDEIALAEPDPLAVEEAAMLTHLTDSHEELMADLLGLAGSRLPRGMIRSLPLALDRHGITLRCEYESGHCDLQLLFPALARDATDAGEQIRRLLTAPRSCAHQQHHSHP
ncbi:DUF2470 domain-containing protein [Streptomyces sp. NPDC049967]|uniref:DUF2470 domain-containing protein n=1 Tax=unclassified Streptomyces TaxID=2593676 RepID=UPI00093A3C75|nr:MULTISPECIES: DUF2470 domain-containing protein [unclassified Streptomyces]OKK21685.1 hypothetical protein AMK09_14655 [Streptomyces sp. CB02488]WSJ26308.1 DUF2470 domain-containing protein [Streptomyces sp. NBC_01324]